ncbi:ras association domain-containing protein 5 [Melopsittacus undulatus]|uniref:ras association domain-containing protein 5 n=1 Tax=Melopsittacus undulatus TaxID=13146 RepID=UPI00146B63DD|nr:ras association domain-containing protein 5-like [Melopsittacus undulatus]
MPPPPAVSPPPGRSQAPALRSRSVAGPGAVPPPASMRRLPPGPSTVMGGRTPGSPGGARAARRRLRRRSGTPRLLPDVRSIFVAPREPAERGRGHRFGPRPPRRGWCDLCGEAVRERALRCEYCRYTCHQECLSLIQLDCRRPSQCQSQLSPEGTLLPPCSQVMDNQGKSILKFHRTPAWYWKLL